MNIVANVLQVLTPLIAGRIASAFGISPALATTAVGALVPAILAALAGKASTTAGANALSSALGSQDLGILTSLGSKLESPDKASLIAGGNGVLASLLGGSAPSALATAAAKFTGMDPSAATGLVGTLVPVVLGKLSETQKQSGLDAGGLAQLLESQKQNISNALPSGFTNLLAGTGLLESIANVPKPIPSGPAVTPSVPQAPSFNWLPYAVGVAAALVLYALLAKPASSPSATGEKTVTSSPSPVATAQAEALKQSEAVFTNLQASLANIKDAATAQAAVPDLTKSSAAADSLQSLTALLPPEARAKVTTAIATALPNLLPLVQKALAIPGVEPLLKPLLDPIIAKLTALSKG